MRPVVVLLPFRTRRYVTLASNGSALGTRLTSHLQQFIWEFIDDKKQYQRIVTTPLEFARSLSGYDVSATMSLVHDPRHPYEAVYSVERLGSVVGGRPIKYLNLPIEKLKAIAIELIKVGFRRLDPIAELISCFFRTIIQCGLDQTWTRLVTPRRG